MQSQLDSILEEEDAEVLRSAFDSTKVRKTWFFNPSFWKINFVGEMTGMLFSTTTETPADLSWETISTASAFPE